MDHPHDPVVQSYERWKANLVDLSTSNRLLQFKVDLNALQIVQPAPRDLLRYLLDPDAPPCELKSSAGPREPGVIVGRAANHAPASILRSLRNRAQANYAQHGTHILAVTFGIMEWTTRDGKQTLQSPLLTLPVILDRADAFSEYTLTPAGRHPDLGFNPALAAAVRREYGSASLDRLMRDPGASLDTVIDTVRDRIADHLRKGVVHDTTYLTMLPYSKFVIREDLERHEQRFLRHPVIRAIGGDPAAIVAVPASGHVTAPIVDPAPQWQVLDADQSQREAIAAVNLGESMVIQGPPGTGKSQTITNLIAESIGRGKTVLFVSEKRAALRVVSQRLADHGLGEFCLDLHDEDLDEEATVSALADRVGMTLPPADTNLPPELVLESQAAAPDALAALRLQFDAYFQALCTDSTPFGGTTYDAIGSLAHLATGPIVQFDYDAASAGSLTAERLDEFARVLDDLVEVAPIIIDPSHHPWRYADPYIVNDDPVTRYRLGDRLAALVRAASTLVETEQAIRLAWGLPASTTREGSTHLAALLDACIPEGRVVSLPEWFQQARYDEAKALLADDEAGRVHRDALRDDLLDRYQAAFLDADLVPRLQAQMLVTDPGILQIDPALGGEPEIPPLLQLPARVAAALVLAAIRESLDLGRQITRRFGLEPAKTLAHLRQVQGLTQMVRRRKPPRRDWFQPDRCQELVALATEAREHARTRSGRDTFLQQWKPGIFDLADEEAIASFEREDPNLIQVMMEFLRGDLLRAEELAIPPRPLSRRELADVLAQAQAIRTSDGWFLDHAGDLDTAFGHYDNGPETDWDDLLAALELIRTGSDLIDPANPPAALVDFPEQIAPSDDLVADFDEAVDRLESAIAMLEQVATGPVLLLAVALHDRPLAEVATRIEIDHLRGYGPLVAVIQALSPLRVAPWTSFDDLARDLNTAAGLVDHEDRLRDCFGPHYTGSNTNWPVIAASLDWIGRIRERFGIGDPSPALIAHLGAGSQLARDHATALKTAIETFDCSRKRLRPFFLPGTMFDETGLASRPLADVARQAQALYDDVNGLERWLFSRRALQEADALGLTSFVAAVRQAGIAPTLWGDAFTRQVLTLWLTARLASAPALAEFTIAQPDTLRETFIRLDRAQLAANALRLVTEQRARVAAAIAEPSYRAEIAALRQLATNGGEYPLRTLFAKAANLLPVLAPCLLMSPETVARLLGESDLEVDLVVFDEASQVVPEDAIGAIGRGSQLVVVGDSRQLPPTTFFQEADDEPDAESLLSACQTAGLRDAWLQWHYRSRHEDLIAFANRESYESRLVTFPSPDHGVDPIEFVQVHNAVYGRGGSATNPEEARRLVDLVIDQVRKEPEASVGIITLSIRQMDAVVQEIERRLPQHKDIAHLLVERGSDGLIVRNLENIQGDEREVIFLSIGYGPDHNGRMHLGFGPLMGSSGKRRLNVAITRARKKVVVLASFDPAELQRANSQGVQSLFRYLDYARQEGSVPRHTGSASSPDDRGFASAVANALERAGLWVVRDVGVGSCRVDIAIRASNDSGSYLLGILCDGSQYPAAIDPRDRERLRPQVLTALGWNLHHVWSLRWQRDPGGEVARIVKRVNDLQRALPPEASPPPPVTPPAPSGPVVDLTGPDDDDPAGFDADFDPGQEGDPGSTPEPAPVPPRKPDPGPPPGTTRPADTEPVDPPAPKPRKPRGRTTTPPTGAAAPASKLAGDIAAIKGLPASAKQALIDAGILTIGDLLAQAGEQVDRRRLARRLGVDPGALNDWVNRADLMRVNGIGPQFADLLEICGVASCRELKERNPENLHAALQQANAERQVTKRLPTLAQVSAWIGRAGRIVAGTGR